MESASCLISVFPLTRKRAYAAAVENWLALLRASRCRASLRALDCRAPDCRSPPSPNLTRTAKRLSFGAPKRATPAESGPRQPKARSIPRMVRPVSACPSPFFEKNPTMPHIGFSISAVYYQYPGAGARVFLTVMDIAVSRLKTEVEGEVERVYRLPP